MFIELTEYLRCPEAHDPEWLVVAPDAMANRRVVSGTVGCPVCRAEYAVRHGVVRFGKPPDRPPSATPLPTADVVQALIGLESPGGYVALVGSAGGLAEGLTPLLAGTHLVAINPREPPGPAPTVLETAAVVPLRDRVVRGVVVGAEYCEDLMLAEARRVVLNGQRVVALVEDAPLPEGLEAMARGQGMAVFQPSR